MRRCRISSLAFATCTLLAASAAIAGIDFAPLTPVFVAARPQYLTTGDLNRDGRTDIVVVSAASKEMAVFIAANTPSGFEPARLTRFPGHIIRAAALGDVDGDGIPDVAVPDAGQNGVWVLVGTGDGTFTTPSTSNLVTNVGANPFSVAIADFDGNGRGDLTVAERSGRVYARINGGGTRPFNTENGPRVCLDGRCDSCNLSNCPLLTAGSQPSNVLTLDLNKDGKPDFLTLDLGGTRGKKITVALFARYEIPQKRVLVLPPRQYAVGEDPESLTVADFNGDDVADLALIDRVQASDTSMVNVLIGQPDGSFSAPVVTAVPCPFFTGGESCRAKALAAGDFDADGDVDFVVALNDPRQEASGDVADALQVFVGRGNGRFAAGPVFAVGKGVLALGAGNIGGDSKDDLAVTTSRTTNLQALLNVSTQGAKGNGEPCSNADECASSRCIDDRCCATTCENNERCDVPNLEGTCQPVPPRVVPCDGPEDCDTGFCVDDVCCNTECVGGRCDVPDFEGVCVPGLPPGELCDDDEECQSGLCEDRCCSVECPEDNYCDEAGVCRPPLDPGDPCDIDAECGTDVCDVFNGICCEERCDALTEDCNEDGECVLLPNITPPTPGTPTPTPTQAPIGGLCSDNGNCVTGICEDGVCCREACGQDEHCEEGTGECVGGPAPATRTPTRIPTQGPLCEGDEDCPPGWQCGEIDGQKACIKTSRSGGGCSTGGGDAPAGGNLLLVAALPLALWFGRRLELRRAIARVRHQ